MYRLKARLENAQGERESLREEYERMQSSVSRLHAERDKSVADLEKAREELERTQVLHKNNVSRIHVEKKRLKLPEISQCSF